MAWQDHLTDRERTELERAERIKTDSADTYRQLRLRLKSRAESRMRERKKPAEG